MIAISYLKPYNCLGEGKKMTDFSIKYLTKGWHAIKPTSQVIT